MKASKELTRYLSSNVWNVSAEGFRVILEAYNGNPFESIHVQLPPNNEQAHIIETLQDCVNDLDERLKKLEPQQDINEAPTLKRNLCV
jgi:RNA binding exosome subunit